MGSSEKTAWAGTEPGSAWFPDNEFGKTGEFPSIKTYQ